MKSQFADFGVDSRGLFSIEEKIREFVSDSELHKDRIADALEKIRDLLDELADEVDDRDEDEDEDEDGADSNDDEVSDDDEGDPFKS
jgi:uncharacterized membrane protein